MGAERHGSKSGGGYVGGFLQLFDWNAKSRKKLFSSKSDIPEQSKQKKRCDGNLPMTRVHLINEDDTTAGSSVKGSSDYSCASSVTDEEFYGIKPAGVVARLMGLDCMPTSNFSEPYSTPFYDSQSLRSAPCLSRNLEYQQDFQSIYSSNLHEKMDAPGRSTLEPKQQKIISRPIEKFQTEILPPKSAKSIPITHCKLLSPIKGGTSIPPQNAAHIMEAAARILEPGPQATLKAKLSLIGSSSVPLKVKDLRERVEASQKVTKIADASRRPAESNASRYLKGQPMNKSWNGSAETTGQKDFPDTDEPFMGGKSKGKSISLALQAKANVQKREGLNSGSSSRSVLGQKEPIKVTSNQLFTSQPSIEKNSHKKPSVHSGSTVLRQNNQKQNSMADRGKPPSKPFISNTQGKRTLGGDSSIARQRSSSKMAENSKVSSRRLSREADNKKEETYSCTKSVTRKKRPSDGDIQYEKHQAAGSMSTHKSGKLIQSGKFMDREMNWGENSISKGTDIISFTFNAPLTRSVPPSPDPPREVQGKSHEFSTDFRSKRMQLSSDGMNSFKAPFGHNLSGGDALSTLLDQKLRELSYVVESSRQKNGTSSSSSSIFQDWSPALNGLSSTTSFHGNRHRDDMEVDDLVSQSSLASSSIGPLGITGQHKHQGMEEELGEYGSNEFECRKVFGSRFPSPISVLEHSFLTESCNSSDTAESNITGASKQSSSVQAKEVLGMSSLKKFHSMEADVDLLDSASSTSGTKEDGKHLKTVGMTNLGESQNWELEYVIEVLRNIESMFMDFAVGRTNKIIDPYLFDQLERVNDRGHQLEQRRKVLFDCVGECLDLRCRQYVEGGYDTWSKGLLLIRNKERLAQEVYKEIAGWSDLGNCMVDELVDKDMSSYFGRWLDFEVEAFELGTQIEKRLLNSLIDEVIADILVL